MAIKDLIPPNARRVALYAPRNRVVRSPKQRFIRKALLDRKLGRPESMSYREIAEKYSTPEFPLNQRLIMDYAKSPHFIKHLAAAERDYSRREKKRFHRELDSYVDESRETWEVAIGQAPRISTAKDKHGKVALDAEGRPELIEEYATDVPEATAVLNGARRDALKFLGLVEKVLDADGNPLQQGPTIHGDVEHLVIGQVHAIPKIAPEVEVRQLEGEEFPSGDELDQAYRDLPSPPIDLEPDQGSGSGG